MQNKHLSIIKIIRDIKSLTDVLYKYSEGNLRYGQCLFNITNAYLNEQYPEKHHIIDDIRGTEYDCFYDDEKVDMFIKKLKELLHD